MTRRSLVRIVTITCFVWGLQEALEVLLTNIGDLERASEYASRVDNKEIWSQLAKVGRPPPPSPQLNRC